MLQKFLNDQHSNRLAVYLPRTQTHMFVRLHDSKQPWSKSWNIKAAKKLHGRRWTLITICTSVIITTNYIGLLIETATDIRHTHGLVHKHETPLPQRDRATRYVSWNLVNCCTLERLAVGMNLKVTQGHRNCLYSIGHILLPISGL